jgi:SAM-dependent methyltransferase
VSLYEWHSDREAALEANEGAYDRRSDADYLRGAPHLRHRSIQLLHRRMVDKLLNSIGRQGRDLKVLELGAGSGLGSAVWMEVRARITAVDASKANLDRFVTRAQGYGVPIEVVHGEMASYVRSCQDRFDVVSHLSVLHHIPDYLALLRGSRHLVARGGGLITLEDPLRYDRISRLNRWAYKAAYFTWRAFQGNYRRGLKTRWRRMRGIYDPSEPADYEEYHVVRNGIDSDAIVHLLRPYFWIVEPKLYWSTFATPLQRVGERIGLRSHFGVLALGRQSRSETVRSITTTDYVG